MRLVFGCNETQLSCFYQRCSVTHPSPFSQCKELRMQSLFWDSPDFVGIERDFKDLRKDIYELYWGLMADFFTLKNLSMFFHIRNPVFCGSIWTWAQADWPWGHTQSLRKTSEWECPKWCSTEERDKSHRGMRDQEKPVRQDWSRSCEWKEVEKTKNEKKRQSEEKWSEHGCQPESWADEKNREERQAERVSPQTLTLRTARPLSCWLPSISRQTLLHPSDRKSAEVLRN